MALETTFDEVVDVVEVKLAGGVAGIDVRRCLEEAAWALDLPGAFQATSARCDLDLSR